jgi:protein-S-isoprenylcysteine O-methyltransferase Ste14
VTAGAASPSSAARAFQFGGALLFFASLTYFLTRYIVDFGRPVAGTPAASAVVWDAALFTAFALHHSVFARRPVRAWIARHAPPPLERSVYVWIASLLFLAVCAFWRPIPGVVWNVQDDWKGVLYGIQALGVVMTVVSAAALDVRELAGLSPITATTSSGEESPVFKTTGPYGWVRHPIYAGWFLMVLPVTPMTMTRFVFAVVSCAYLMMAIPWEERTLLRTSGGAYRTYMKQVRWRLLPGLY